MRDQLPRPARANLKADLAPPRSSQSEHLLELAPLEPEVLFRTKIGLRFIDFGSEAAIFRVIGFDRIQYISAMSPGTDIWLPELS